MQQSEDAHKKIEKLQLELELRRKVLSENSIQQNLYYRSMSNVDLFTRNQ